MKKFLAVVILFSFFLLPFFNVYGVHMLTHDIQRLSSNALWGIGFLFFSNIIWTTLVITIVTRSKILRSGILTATTHYSFDTSLLWLRKTNTNFTSITPRNKYLFLCFCHRNTNFNKNSLKKIKYTLLLQPQSSTKMPYISRAFFITV